MNRKYTHIFFDLDNTLWDFEKNSRSAMLETFKCYPGNGNVDFDSFFKVYSEHNHRLWDSYRKKEVGKKELTRKRFENTFLDLHITGIDPDEMNTRYLNEMPKQKNLNEGALDLLIYLRAKKYQLSIITNGFKEVQHKKLESSGLNPFFNKVFISEELKTPKPGREIFEHAIKSVNAKKSKSVMIGDDWDVDILGALNFGIDAIQLNPSNDKGLIQANNLFVSSNLVYITSNLSHLQELF